MKGFSVPRLRTQLHRDAYALPCAATNFGSNFRPAFLANKNGPAERKGNQADIAEDLREQLLWFEHAESLYLCEMAIVECGHLAATLESRRPDN